MNSWCSRMGAVLLGVLLSACVTSAPIVREDVEAPEVVSSSWDEARAEPTCVVPLCSEERCAIWRCQDVTEGEAHSVLLAQAVVPRTGTALPMPLGPGPSAIRWWGHPLAEPRYAAPVFEIPWHNWKTRELSKRRLYLNQCLTAKAEDMWRFAGELMVRFGVNGPLVPYYCG